MLTTKDRAFLKGLAMNENPILSLGKSSLTPEFTEAVREALKARELIKINVLKNCDDDINEMAQILSERTHSEVVQIIGRKIVLYKRNNENIGILFPGEKTKKPAPAKKPAQPKKTSSVGEKKPYSPVKKYDDRKSGRSYDKKSDRAYDKKSDRFSDRKSDRYSDEKKKDRSGYGRFSKKTSDSKFKRFGKNDR